jgi:hypothetical protein
MKKMKNKYTQLENAFDLVCDLAAEEVEAFRSFVAKKRKQAPPYLQLFEYLLELYDSGVDTDSLSSEQVQAWCEEAKLTTNFNEFVPGLYKNLIEFLGDLFEKAEATKWRAEVRTGLLAVQELIRRGKNSHAAMLIEKLEKKVPQNLNRSVWDDFSPMIGLSVLKMSIYRDFDFLELLESDKFLSELHRNSCSQRINPALWGNGEKTFEKYADQFFYFQLYTQSIRISKNWQQEKKTINDIVKKVGRKPPNKPQLELNKRTSFMVNEPNQYFEECFWHMIGFQQAMHHGQYEDAQKYLKRLDPHNGQNESQYLLEMAISSWLLHITGEVNLIEYWERNYRDKTDDQLPKQTLGYSIYHYTKDVIVSVAHRTELNELMQLIALKQFDEAHSIVAKMLQLQDLFGPVKARLKLLELVIWIELQHTGVREQAGTVYNYFKNKTEEYPFEAALSSILKRLQGYYMQHGGWKNKVTPTEFEKLEAKMKIKEPMHYFFLWWLKEVVHNEVD